jgi:hypothetical protein
MDSNKTGLSKLIPILNLTKTHQTTNYQLETTPPPMKVLFSEHFIPHVVDQSDRLNTAILDETFQMTVRNHRLFEGEINNNDIERGDKGEIFKTAKDELDMLSDEESAEEDGKEGQNGATQIVEKRPSLVLIDH